MAQHGGIGPGQHPRATFWSPQAKGEARSWMGRIFHVGTSEVGSSESDGLGAT